MRSSNPEKRKMTGQPLTTKKKEMKKQHICTGVDIADKDGKLRPVYFMPIFQLFDVEETDDGLGLINEVYNDWRNIVKTLIKHYDGHTFTKWSPPTNFPSDSGLNMNHVICYFLAQQNMSILTMKQCPRETYQNLLRAFLFSDISMSHPCGYDRDRVHRNSPYLTARSVIQFCTRAYHFTQNKAFQQFLKHAFYVDI